MATYANTKGFTVQTVSSDPSASAAAGGTWASAPNLNVARSRIGGSTQATATAGLIFGNGDPPHGETEEYNGSTWSEGGDMQEGRYISYGGGGTQTATITAGGLDPASSPSYQTVFSEEYNGTAWTEVNEISEGRLDCTTFGTSTSALLVGGAEAAGGPGTVTSVESWNGSSWSSGTAIPTARQEMAGWGLSTAGAIVGGSQDSNPTMTAETVEWNGSAWTAGGDYSSVVKYFAAFGTADNGIAAGGSNGPSKLAVAANYNGTSWTEVAEIATARQGNMANGASGTSGLTAGGEIPPGAQSNATEVWDAPAVFSQQFFGDVFFNSTTNTFKVTNYSVPAGTWASGTSFPATVVESGGIGSSASDGLVVTNPAASPAVYAYDGTSWTAAGSMVTYRRQRMLGAGSSTAGLFAGGSTASPVEANKSDKTETWNGSSWTEVNELNQASYTNSAGRCGTSTSAIKAGGILGSPTPETFSDTNESWNGTNWSEEAELNTGRRSQGGTGTSNTNSMIIGGGVPPNNASDLCEKWNGTSWTETGELNTARYQQCAAGDTGSALCYGGNLYPSPPPYSALTEIFNGTSWTEASDLSMGRQYLQGGGSSSGCIGVGGYGPTGAVVANTEEWTAPLGNQTITST